MPLNTVQQAKRLIKIVVGFTLLLAGAVMLITPGPGWAAIIGGLALLTEFAWARWLLNKIKDRGIQIRDAVMNKAENGKGKGEKAEVRRQKAEL